MSTIVTRTRLAVLGLAGVASIAAASPSMAGEVGKNTLIGAGAGAAAGGLLTHSAGGAIGGALVGGVLGHTLSPRDHRRYYGHRSYGHRYYHRGYRPY